MKALVDATSIEEFDEMVEALETPWWVLEIIQHSFVVQASPCPSDERQCYCSVCHFKRLPKSRTLVDDNGPCDGQVQIKHEI